MDKPRIEKILEKCTPDEKIRVTTLYNGSLKALKAYQDALKAAEVPCSTTASSSPGC